MNNIIFTIARMNPPTSGHMMLIKTMMNKAIDFMRQGNNAIVGIVLSHTVDDDKNPLSCEEKRDMLLVYGMIDSAKDQIKQSLTGPEKDMVDNIRVIILCKDDTVVQEQKGNFPIQSINALVQLYGDIFTGVSKADTKLHLIIGEDRATSYDWLKKSLNLTIEALPRPEGAMSATTMRNLVREDKLDEFKENMKSTGIDDESSERIFNILHEKINTAVARSSAKKARTKRGGKRSKRSKSKTTNRRTVRRRYYYKRG
jgi:hypothetical protein